jgi:hypothetical protein
MLQSCRRRSSRCTALLLLLGTDARLLLLLRLPSHCFVLLLLLRALRAAHKWLLLLSTTGICRRGADKTKSSNMNS